LDKFDKLSSVGGLVVALAALAVSIWWPVRALRVPAVDPAMVLCRAVDDLAETVARQWRAEVNARGLGHLDPIRVHWSATSRLAVLLTLSLLERRQPGAPMRVLVTVSSWDPDREHLDTWLVRRLGELYLALGGRGRYGIDAAVRLVDRGLVTPILDGLDEMPEPVQARAINALTVAVGRDRPLVLTSRADEYLAAVAQAGSPLARAAVVEIEPITAAAAAYLPTGQVDGVTRWRPVLAHLTAHPDWAPARTLRTPLRCTWPAPRTERRAATPTRSNCICWTPTHLPSTAHEGCPRTRSTQPRQAERHIPCSRPAGGWRSSPTT
jgi:hypothetical protein